MKQAELEQIIEQARLDRRTSLNLRNLLVTPLPESIGNLVNLTYLDLGENLLTSLPESIGNLINLTHLDLGCDPNANAPLTNTDMQTNDLTSLPESIGNLINLTHLNLEGNLLTRLPESIGNLVNLTHLSTYLSLWGKPTNLLENIGISDLVNARFSGGILLHRYLTKSSEWKSEWLLDENNAEIRRELIAKIGYEKICHELNAVTVDTWREYTLLKIDGVGRGYNHRTEPMVLLKRICPSTQHIHVLRVPPKMTSAEAAITWVNHGTHPDRLAVWQSKLKIKPKPRSF